MPTTQELIEDKPRLIWNYQTPGKIHLQVRSKFTPSQNEFWQLEFVNKNYKLIKVICVQDNDIIIDKLDFYRCELYWTNMKIRFGLHIYTHPMYRKSSFGKLAL